MKGSLAIFKGGAESFLGAHQKKLWLVKQEEGSRRRGLLFRGVGGKEGSEAHTVRGDAIPREGMIGRSMCNIPLLLGQANFSGFEQACRWSLREKSSHAGPFNATTKAVVQTAVHAKKTRDLTMQLRLFSGYGCASAWPFVPGSPDPKGCVRRAVVPLSPGSRTQHSSDITQRSLSRLGFPGQAVWQIADPDGTWILSDQSNSTSNDGSVQFPRICHFSSVPVRNLADSLSSCLSETREVH